MEVHERPLDWETPVHGYDYRIVTDDGSEGHAQIIFQLVSETESRIQKVLSDKGIQPQDTMAQLNVFYPNARMAEMDADEAKRYTRKGIGTLALCFLEARAALEGARVLYACSISPSMQSFCKKRGFTTFGRKKAHHVKILKPPNENTEEGSMDPVARLLASLREEN